MDKANQCLWLDTQQVSLSLMAFPVLFYLSERPGRLVTKQKPLDAVWPGIFVSKGVLKRAVLEAAGGSRRRWKKCQDFASRFCAGCAEELDAE